MTDVLAVCTDLYFQSRLASAARAAGRSLRFVHALDDLEKCRLAFVDLDATVDALEAIRTLQGRQVERIVAFGPHVDGVRRRAAKVAGAHRVLAKSKFVSELPVLMAISVSGETAVTSGESGRLLGSEDR